MTVRIIAVLLVLTGSAGQAQAQLNEVVADLFNTILLERLSLSPGNHANHYVPAAEEAVGSLTPALNGLIANNIWGFPLSATAAGVTFDFSTGQPVSILESQGPIYAETASTLGQGSFNVGANATFLSLDRLRGVPLEDVQFTFPHEDVGQPGLGDLAFEEDVIDINMGLNVDASIFALSATYGVLRNLDVGIALPIVSVSIDGTARAVMDSRTFTRTGTALHFFGGTDTAPVLAAEESYEGSATGIGDVSVRLKYRLPVEEVYGVAVLLDVRLPTGSEEDFIGSGSLGFRTSLIGSAEFSGFNPHVNLGYDYRGGGDFQRDALAFAVGFDQQLVSRVTFAASVLGTVNVGEDPFDLLPGAVTIAEVRPGGTVTREVPLSNVPDGDGDHAFTLSVGTRVAFSESFQALGNVFVPLNDGGLRSSVTPTLGVSLTF